MAGTQGYRTILDYHRHSGTDRIGNIKIEMTMDSVGILKLVKKEFCTGSTKLKGFGGGAWTYRYFGCALFTKTRV